MSLNLFISSGVVASSASGFNPKKQAGLVGWWDANDITTITKDVSQRVSLWNDKSNSNFNLQQGTLAAQPIYSATSYNGRPGITFDGVDDYLFLNNQDLGYTPHIFVALNIVSQGGSSALWYSDGGNGYHLGPYNRGANVTAAISTFGLDLVPPPYLSTPFNTDIIVSNFFGRNTGTNDSFIKGPFNQISYTISAGDYQSVSNNNLLIGALYVAGHYSNVRFAEIVIYNSKRSPAQISEIETYLSNKWGV